MNGQITDLYPFHCGCVPFMKYRCALCLGNVFDTEWNERHYEGSGGCSAHGAPPHRGYYLPTKTGLHVVGVLHQSVEISAMWSNDKYTDQPELNFKQLCELEEKRKRNRWLEEEAQRRRELEAMLCEDYVVFEKVEVRATLTGITSLWVRMGPAAPLLLRTNEGPYVFPSFPPFIYLQIPPSLLSADAGRHVFLVVQLDPMGAENVSCIRAFADIAPALEWLRAPSMRDRNVQKFLAALALWGPDFYRRPGEHLLSFSKLPITAELKREVQVRRAESPRWMMLYRNSIVKEWRYKDARGRASLGPRTIFACGESFKFWEAMDLIEGRFPRKQQGWHWGPCRFKPGPVGKGP